MQLRFYEFLMPYDKASLRSSGVTGDFVGILSQTVHAKRGISCAESSASGGQQG